MKIDQKNCEKQRRGKKAKKIALVALMLFVMAFGVDFMNLRSNTFYFARIYTIMYLHRTFLSIFVISEEKTYDNKDDEILSREFSVPYTCGYGLRLMWPISPLISDKLELPFSATVYQLKNGVYQEIERRLVPKPTAFNPYVRTSPTGFPLLLSGKKYRLVIKKENWGAQQPLKGSVYIDLYIYQNLSCSPVFAPFLGAYKPRFIPSSQGDKK